MLKFTYQVTINALPFDDDKKFVERLSGTLEETSHAHATKQVQRLSFERCRELERECGDIFGYENVQVTAVQDMATTPAMTYANFMQAYKEGKAFPASMLILVTATEFAQHEHDLIEEVFKGLQVEIEKFWQKREVER